MLNNKSALTARNILAWLAIVIAVYIIIMLLKYSAK